MEKFQCNVISYVLQRTVDITVAVPTITIPEFLATSSKQPSHVVKKVSCFIFTSCL